MADVITVMIRKHHCKCRPWWLEDIIGRLDSLIELEETFMADLEQAVADLKSAVQAAAIRVSADIATLKDELAKAGGASAAAQAAADSIEEQVAALNAVDAATPEPPADQAPAETPPTV